MKLTAEQRLHQSMTKMHLIAARELRRFQAGETDYIPGDWINRETLDAIRNAYAAGFRDGRRALAEGGGDG